MKKIVTAIIIWSLATPTYALTYTIKKDSDIVGEVQTATVLPGESLADIGRKFDVGIYEMLASNPSLHPKRPRSGSKVVVPSQFILPTAQRQELVINLAEMRLYYFHKDGNMVSTHPIGIGREEWETPVGQGTIIQKTKDPTWRPPASIRHWYEEHEMYLPEIVPPGPKNPLGKYAMRLSIPGYLIHGTNRPSGIGLRTSSGCIRMYPEDIESLYYKIPLGTSVRIVNKPYKIGKHYGKLYLEAHQLLTGGSYEQLSSQELLEMAMIEAGAPLTKAGAESIGNAIRQSRGYPILMEN